MNPQFWAAVVGTIVGGLITIVLWRLSLHETRRQRDEDRAEERRQREEERKEGREALANSLVFKMTKVCSSVHAIHHHFEECHQDAMRDGFKGEPWQFVLQLANPPEPMHFSADEMGMLLGLRDDPVFNSVMEMESRHNSLIGAVNAFNRERTALAESYAAASIDHVKSGGKVTSTIAGKDRDVLRPKMIGVNSLIDLAHSSARDANVLGRKTAEQLQALLRSRLGLKYKLAFALPLPGTGPEK